MPGHEVSRRGKRFVAGSRLFLRGRPTCSEPRPALRSELTLATEGKQVTARFASETRLPAPTRRPEIKAIHKFNAQLALPSLNMRGDRLAVVRRRARSRLGGRGVPECQPWSAPRGPMSRSDGLCGPAPYRCLGYFAAKGRPLVAEAWLPAGTQDGVDPPASLLDANGDRRGLDLIRRRGTRCHK